MARQYTRISDLRDPITGLFPPLAGADGADDEDTGTDDTGSTDDTGEEQHDAEHYRRQLREYERNSKRRSAAKDAEIQALKDRLAAAEAADLSDQERAIAEARDAARTEVLTEVERERRHDRLEAQVSRLAAKSFADVDDALLHIEWRLTDGVISTEDIFDSDGKVIGDALTGALKTLLEEKPHLAATANGGRPAGDADAGKGAGAKSLDQQIRDAEEAGDVKESIRLKNRKLFAQAQ